MVFDMKKEWQTMWSFNENRVYLIYIMHYFHS